MKITKKKKFKPIICAGMTQSGSTAAWNLVKFIFDIKSIPYKYGFIWKNSIDKPPYYSQKTIMEWTKTSDVIAKIHERKNLTVLPKDSLVIFSIRDVRDCAASSKRRHKSVNIDSHIKNNIEIFNSWFNIANFVISYDALIQEQKSLVKEIANLLKISLNKNETNVILDKLNNIPTDNYQKFLLNTHVTDPKHKLSYKDTFSFDEIREMDAKFFDFISHFQTILPTQVERKVKFSITYAIFAHLVEVIKKVLDLTVSKER